MAVANDGLPTEADGALVPPYVTSLGNYENSGSPCTLQFILAMTLASHRMISTTLFFLLLCSSTLTFASDTSSWRRVTASSSSRNVPPQGYYNPADKGGSMLDQVPDTIPPGQGEPLNVIISGASDPAVLLSSQVGGGLLNYYLSLGFATECLGQHLGVHQGANLGDGNGVQNETAVIRWDYGDPAVGTCKETIEGGNHFRYWIQNGAAANSGAIFMAVSYEEPLAGMFFVSPPCLVT